MGLMDFFTPEAGQARRKWLDQQAEGLVEFVPPELRNWVALGGEVNPITSMERAGQGAQRIADPNVQGWDKVKAVGDTASNMAAVVAPMVAASRGAVPAANAIEEALMGVSSSPAGMAGRQFAADEFGGMNMGGDAISARGSQIMDMLKAGRGSDVTDAMLDLGDPVQNARLNEWLFNNYDLPMDAGSRDARAWQMGMRDNVYHGTNTAPDYLAFDKSKYSKRYETYVAPEAHRDYANSYAYSDQGRVLPLKANVSGFHDGRTSAGREVLKDLAYEHDFQPELYTNHLRGDPDTRRAVTWADQNSIDALNGAGYPGVVIEERPMMDSYAVFDPSRLRSRFARFDPRLAHLKNLSAGVAGLGLMQYGQPQE